MRSEGEYSKTVADADRRDQRQKKVVLPPKSSKLTKVKKPNFLIKTLKLKGKSSPTPQQKISSKSVDLAGGDLEEPSRSPVVERQTPEGDDSFMLARSSSETILAEGAWKSAENLTEEPAASRKSIQPCDCPDPEPLSQQDHRTKSLEDLKDMPAYGDLIVDPSPPGPSSFAGKPSGERKDHLYKILVIGDLGAGKTSIIKRYVHRFFTQHYRATIGVDFALKVLNWDENTLIRLQLWDIAGQERYGNMTRVYYKEAVGAFIVFDVTRVTTFESAAKWKSDLDSKVQLPDGSPIPCVLLANKCDQPKEGIVNNPHKMDDYCSENGFVAWFETSAKDNINIDEAAKALVSKILDNDILLSVDSNKDDEKFALERETNAQKGKVCPC